MKKAYFILMILSGLLLSCSDADQDGDWDDNIELSQKKVQFSAAEDAILITTNREGWWINEVSFNGNSGFESTETSKDGFLIDEEEFRVEKTSPTEIYIEVSANTTGAERILKIGLQNGNYFDGISVTQSAQ